MDHKELTQYFSHMSVNEHDGISIGVVGAHFQFNSFVYIYYV